MASLARELIAGEMPREQTVESVVVGTAVFEAALLELRRLAHSHYSASRFGDDPDAPGSRG